MSITINLTFKTITTLFFSAVFLSCVSSKKKSTSKQNIVNTITKVPTSFIYNFEDKVEASEKISISTKILNTAVVARDYVNIRNGPGGYFHIQNKHLEREAEVIIFESYKNWLKIFIPEYKSIGWVHKKTLNPQKVLSPFISLDKNLLPLVFAVKDIKKIYDYKSVEAIPIAIPKGAAFYFLRQEEGLNLIVIPSNNTLAWVDKNEVN